MNLQFLSTGAGENRLKRLIQKRLEPGANNEAIDAMIWDLFGEEWAVMFTDLSGFSRNVARFGIIHFLVTIYESERLLTPVIEDHSGFILKVEGDSFLVIFRKPRRALECAVAMQNTLEAYNRNRVPEEKVLLCVGLGFGRVLRIGDDDVYGSEVNVASKLGEDTAKSGEIIVSEQFYKAVNREVVGNWQKLEMEVPGSEGIWKYVY